jgi:cell division septation protein DedD
MADKKQGMIKDGTRRRAPMTGGRGGGMPRIIWLGIFVSVVGAVFLFRNQSTSVPTGIGENQTVVTAPEVAPALETEIMPRSGEVDISDEVPTITPEHSAQGTDERPAAAAATAADAAPTPATPVTRTPSVTAQPAEEPVIPQPDGPYVVQIGSFGQAENADQEAARVTQLGFKALVKVGNTSDGTIIYRVRIGYFKSRGEAETFIKQNKSHMGGAIAVHR